MIVTVRLALLKSFDILALYKIIIVVIITCEYIHRTDLPRQDDLPSPHGVSPSHRPCTWLRGCSGLGRRWAGWETGELADTGWWWTTLMTSHSASLVLLGHTHTDGQPMIYHINVYYHTLPPVSILSGIYRVVQIKWHHFTFLLVTNGCIHQNLQFLACINYIKQQMSRCQFYVNKHIPQV